MIPRRLVRTVPTTTTAEVEAFWAHTLDLHPGWETVTHRDPIDPTLFPLTSPHWAACSSGAQLAGLIRLEDLYHHGGIYLDSDMQMFRPLDTLLEHRAFAAWEDGSVIPDAVLGFEAHHPALTAMISDAITLLPHGAWESGPGVTTRNLQGRNDVTLLPPVTFYPVHYLDKGELDSFNPEDHPEAFGMHRWHASWPGSYQG